MAIKTTHAGSPQQKTSGGSLQPGRIRRDELDWLRAFAVFGLIPFHAAVIFTTGSRDYVKDAQTSRLMDIFASFITFWGIPLLFFVAGAASRYALAGRGPGRFVYERLTRLAIPFLFAMVTVVPIQVYVGEWRPGEPFPSFVTFYASFLSGLFGIFLGKIPTQGANWIGHLWFIPPLLLFSLLTLPLFRALEKPEGQQWLARLARFLGASGLILVFGTIPGITQGLLQAAAAFSPAATRPIYVSLAGVVLYLIVYIYGYVLYADPRFLFSMGRFAWQSILLGLAAWITYQIVTMSGHAPAPEFTSGYMVFSLLRGFVGWWWVMGIVGCAVRYLRFSTRALRYLTTATYPVYIIHMPILTLLAYMIVQTSWPMLAKFLIIVTGTLVVSLLIYEFSIRRLPPLRFLFGLHVRPPRAGPAASSPGPVSPPAAPGDAHSIAHHTATR